MERLKASIPANFVPYRMEIGAHDAASSEVPLGIAWLDCVHHDGRSACDYDLSSRIILSTTSAHRKAKKQASISHQRRHSPSAGFWVLVRAWKLRAAETKLVSGSVNLEVYCQGLRVHGGYCGYLIHHDHTLWRVHFPRSRCNAAQSRRESQLSMTWPFSMHTDHPPIGMDLFP
eukprot:1392693-Amphidinium_carterae.1